MTQHDPTLDALLDQGLALHRAGQLAEARARYQALLQRAPAHARAWHLLAVAALQANQPEAALAPLEQATRLDPENLAALKDYARTLLTLARFEGALDAYGRALALAPADPELHAGRGNALFELKALGDAIASYDEALRLDPRFAGGHFNRAMALLDLQDFGAALASFEAALSLDGSHARAHNFRGVALRSLGRLEEAAASFEAAARLRADYADAHMNRGLALLELEAWPAALASFEAATRLAPDFADAFNNRGNALYRLGRLEAALDSYQRAVELGPDFPGMHFNRAQMLAELGRYREAALGFDRTLALEPAFPYAQGEALLARLQAGEWQDYGARLERLREGLARGERVATPFALLTLSDSPQLQQRAARAWMSAEVRGGVSRGAARPRGDKLVVGYFSPDFRDHPVARLAAPLFEHHDRARFQILAFSFGPPAQDALRRRVQNAVDRFIDVGALSSPAVAACARECGVEVAVDLAGLTKHCRPQIFAERAAPVQAAYLGYLGTLGASFMDYLIADHTLVPDALRAHYDEKLAYLPAYHVNDAARLVSDTAPTRASLGVPPGAFAFACFNSPYKITPDTFGRWMRILQRVPHAVLMLQGDAALAAGWRAEAERLGVAPRRVLSAPRLALGDYLARFKALDLFLDTSPYNAGTTASDALLSGMPLLTLAGDTFSGRIATSALESVGLGELVCRSAQDYEDLAVAIAGDPEHLRRLGQRLRERRASSALFDAGRFTAYLERAFEHMADGARHGDAPEDFEIGA